MLTSSPSMNFTKSARDFSKNSEYVISHRLIGLPIASPYKFCVATTRRTPPKNRRAFLPFHSGSSSSLQCSSPICFPIDNACSGLSASTRWTCSSNIISLVSASKSSRPTTTVTPYQRFMVHLKNFLFYGNPKFSGQFLFSISPLHHHCRIALGAMRKDQVFHGLRASTHFLNFDAVHPMPCKRRLFRRRSLRRHRLPCLLVSRGTIKR
jgi:hypothetical protein